MPQFVVRETVVPKSFDSAPIASKHVRMIQAIPEGDEPMNEGNVLVPFGGSGPPAHGEGVIIPGPNRVPGGGAVVNSSGNQILGSIPPRPSMGAGRPTLNPEGVR